MVVARNAELYTPFEHGVLADDTGVQSSEEGSDLHSPTFEVPVPQDIRYPLGHHPHPNVDNALSVAPHFDARYQPQNLDVQIPDPHLLETLQVPGTIPYHIPPPQSHVDFDLHHQHSVFDLSGVDHPHIQHPPPALSPSEGYSFNLPQSRYSEQQLRVSYEPPLAPSRSSFGMAPNESSEQQPHRSPSASGGASGSNASSAPTQPPRRAASNQVIACRQCRGRKIRCDSTRPTCHNCARRGNECEYDAVPKRRGPDKRPGTRQRSCKKRPSEAESSTSLTKKRKTEEDGDGSLIAFDVRQDVTSNGQRALMSPPQPGMPSHPEEGSGFHLSQAPPLVLETSRTMVHDPIYPKQIEASTLMHSPLYPMESSRPYRHTPPSSYHNSPWWDKLLNTYGKGTTTSVDAMCSDLEFLIETSNYWLFFLKSETLINKLKDPRGRAQLQPALVFAALAMANLMKSSELERGRRGRELALALRNEAQQLLEAACSSQSLDFMLAEAALILALFETSSHPEHNSQRAAQALQFVDRIIYALSLQRIDEDDPQASRFRPEDVPIVYTPGYEVPERCRCVMPPLPTSPGDQGHYAVTFTFIPPWCNDQAEDYKEECRRICWAALNMMSSYTATCAVFHQEPVALKLTEPSTFALFFPGEAYERRYPTTGQSPKQSVWALYCRSMLLWNSVTQRRTHTWSTDKRARFAVDAFNEVRCIQEAIDMHQCNSDTSLIYLCREFLYNTRMTVSYEFRSLTPVYGPPIFTRRQAEEWLYYQCQIVKKVQESVKSLDDAGGHLLTRRPFQVQWFATQISLCLSLWEFDHQLPHALDLAKGFLIPLDTLNVLWPCPVQQARCDELRARLIQACHAAHVQEPLKASVSLPPRLANFR